MSYFKPFVNPINRLLLSYERNYKTKLKIAEVTTYEIEIAYVNKT